MVSRGRKEFEGGFLTVNERVLEKIFVSNDTV